MSDFRILTDTVLLHLARQPLIVLSVVFLLILAVTAALVGRQLRRRTRSENEPERLVPEPNQSDKGASL